MRAAVPVRERTRGVLADDQVLAAQGPDDGLRHVVAERVEQPRDDRLGAGPEFRLAGRIELQEVALAARVGDREARRDAVRLAADGPGAGLRPRIVAGPAEHLVGVNGCVPTRLVNQLESGTSSIVLTLSARPTGLQPGRPNRLITAS